MTTQARPPGPSKASPSPLYRHAASTSPWLGKVTSSRSGNRGLLGLGPSRKLRGHALLGALASGGALVVPDVVLVGVPRDLHRVRRAVRVVPAVLHLIAADRLLHLRDRRQGVVPARIAGDELRLQLDEREERRHRLRETDERQVIDPG